MHGRAWIILPAERKNAEGSARHVHSAAKESNRFRAARHSKGPLRHSAKKERQRTTRTTRFLNDHVCYRLLGKPQLRNAFRHAQADTIESEIRYESRQLRVHIRDDGKGIDSEILKTGGLLVAWTEEELAKEVPIPLPSGSCMFHHSLTLHGSHANTSDRPRRAIALHYMTEQTIYDASGNHVMKRFVEVQNGEPMRGEHFPLVYQRKSTMAATR